MPGQEHAGPAGELPAGGLPKDEQCQAPFRFQLSASRCRRLLGAAPQHRADPGEPTVGEDTQHALLCGEAEPKICCPLRNTALLSRI